MRTLALLACLALPALARADVPNEDGSPSAPAPPPPEAEGHCQRVGPPELGWLLALAVPALVRRRSAGRPALYPRADPS